jgi:spore coat polysaccharide biosynthesis protein SpsF
VNAVVAVIQARMTSSRLPGKVLKPLAGAPLLARMIERVRRIRGVDRICVAIPEGPAHAPIADLVGRLGDVALVRGPEDDVLHRTKLAADACGAGTVVRLTSDCPMIDPDVSAAVLAISKETGAPYARTAFATGFPLGFDTEVIAAAALSEADREATDPYEREHVTPFLWRRPDRYPIAFLDRRPARRAWRLVVDTAEDYQLASRIYDALYPANPAFGFAEIEALFAARPELLDINRASTQNPYLGLPPGLP